MIESGQFVSLKELDQDQYRALYKKCMACSEDKTEYQSMILTDWWRHDFLGLCDNGSVVHANESNINVFAKNHVVIDIDSALL